MKKITLITVCYNSAGTVADTLKSVNEQIYENIEHIIIDGASTDNTLDVVKKLGQRVTKVISEPDKGIFDAYNKGLALASGEIIGILNSDDFYFDENVISKVMSVFDDPSVDACHANLIYVDSLDTNLVTRFWKSWDMTGRHLELGYMPAHPTLFLRREVYDRVGNFDLKRHPVADHDFCVRAFYIYDIRALYINDLWVRMRNGGATGGSLRSIIKQNEQLLATLRKYGCNTSVYVFFSLKILQRFVQFFRAKLFMINFRFALT